MADRDRGRSRPDSATRRAIVQKLQPPRWEFASLLSDNLKFMKRFLVALRWFEGCRVGEVIYILLRTKKLVVNPIHLKIFQSVTPLSPASGTRRSWARNQALGRIERIPLDLVCPIRSGKVPCTNRACHTSGFHLHPTFIHSLGHSRQNSSCPHF